MSKGHVIDCICAIGDSNNTSSESSIHKIAIQCFLDRCPVIALNCCQRYTDYCCCYKEPHHLYNNQIPSVSIMKSLDNAQQESKNEIEHPEQLHKRLAELRQVNTEKETLISTLEQEVKGLEETNNALKQEKQVQEKLWEELREKEEEKEEQDEQEMQQWIEQVQKQNGLSQQSIDSLLSIEFEGGQQEICPACYQELKAGVMCTYLPCAHLFHQECIVNHLKVNRFCLACQEAVVV